MTGNWDRIKAHLETTGHITHDGVTRRVTARTCTTCHAPVLAGLDGDLCAWDVRVDPDPLSPLGEVLALLADRPTFSLKHRGGRYQLDPREQFGIAGQPAGSRDYDVVALHECGTLGLPTIPSAYQPTPRPATGDQPPF